MNTNCDKVYFINIQITIVLTLAKNWLVKLSLTVRIISFFLLHFFINKFIRILKRYWIVPVLKQSLTNYTKYKIQIYLLVAFYPLHCIILFKMKNQIVVWDYLFVLFLFNILLTNIGFWEGIQKLNCNSFLKTFNGPHLPFFSEDNWFMKWTFIF